MSTAEVHPGEGLVLLQYSHLFCQANLSTYEKEFSRSSKHSCFHISNFQNSYQQTFLDQPRFQTSV